MLKNAIHTCVQKITYANLTIVYDNSYRINRPLLSTKINLNTFVSALINQKDINSSYSYSLKTEF